MPILIDPSLADQQREIVSMLHELNIAVHRTGYKQLTIAILRYAQDDAQSLTKEVYPFVAKRLRYSDWRAVEHAIRICILHGWLHRTPEVWDKYFPGLRKAPSNKLFIATLADQLQ